MDVSSDLYSSLDEIDVLPPLSESVASEYDFSYIENDVHSINETLVTISDDYDSLVHYSHLSYVFVVAIWVLVFISVIRGFIWR